MKTSQIAIFAFLALAIGGAVWYFFLRSNQKSTPKFATLREAFDYWIDNYSKNGGFRRFPDSWFRVMTGEVEPPDDGSIEVYNAEKASWDKFRKKAGF